MVSRQNATGLLQTQLSMPKYPAPLNQNLSRFLDITSSNLVMEKEVAVRIKTPPEREKQGFFTQDMDSNEQTAFQNL